LFVINGDIEIRFVKDDTAVEKVFSSVKEFRLTVAVGEERGMNFEGCDTST
jgi:hypothetical protein